jgi:hypothetical protein
MKLDRYDRIAEKALWTLEGIVLYMISAIFYKVVIAGM